MEHKKEYFIKVKTKIKTQKSYEPSANPPRINNPKKRRCVL